MADKPEPFTTPVRFDELERLLPELERRAGSGLEFNPWGDPPTPDPLAGALYRVAHEGGCIYKNFSWADWHKAGGRLLKGDALERADLDTCCKLLTVIVRQERFSEGSLTGHIESGFAARLVRRIKVARRTPPPGVIDVAEDMLGDEEREERENEDAETRTR